MADGDSESGPSARRQTTCVVCGQDNPGGLHLHFETAGAREVAANWRPSSSWEGFHGIIHGGIVSTVLDEAMSKAVAASGYEALTAELRVRFRLRVETGKDYRIRGWVVDRAKRRLQTEASINTADGVEHAHAWAVFLAPR